MKNGTRAVTLRFMMLCLTFFVDSFFTEAGRPIDWAHADHFAFNIRYVQQQEAGVLAASGGRGVYVEPKTDDAGGPSLKFQVVWLPQLSFEEVSHRSQCEALSLGIARSGKRYGVRVKAEHFQQVFQTLKPDGLFLPPGVRSTWHCGPWPFGVDGKSLASVFKQWKWSARTFATSACSSRRHDVVDSSCGRSTSSSFPHAAWAGGSVTMQTSRRSNS